jgi:hypothetical protein
MPSIHQLLPSERDLSLLAHGDDPRPDVFLRLFRSAWARIAPEVQTRILAEWRSSPVYRSMVDLHGTSFAVEISNLAAAHCYHGVGGHVATLYDPLLKRLYYWTPELYSQPVKQAERVIAHELVHAWQMSFLADLGDLVIDEAETRAERTLQAWGFPPDGGCALPPWKLLAAGAKPDEPMMDSDEAVSGMVPALAVLEGISVGDGRSGGRKARRQAAAGNQVAV